MYVIKRGKENKNMLHAYQKELKGNTVGIVFGSFAPLHQGHLDCIYRAKKENDGGALVISCGYDGDKGEPLMPHCKRYRYVREFFANDDLVAVYSINDSELGLEEYPKGWKGWLEEFERIWSKAVVGNPDRVWYVGDLNYYVDLTSFGEKCILLDRLADNPISATKIRNNPIKHWDKITLPFRRVFSTNILICGTASEGKSVLTEDLGKYFNAPYSYEYARQYMKESCVADWELNSADYLAFLEGQYRLNRKLICSKENNGLFFADSDSMVTRMYAEYYSKDKSCALTEKEFEALAVTADEITAKCKWDKIYLLCPKGVFVDDHERFMAHSGMKERLELFEILCNNIKRSGNWDKVTILDKGYYENFEYIKKEIKEIIENGKN